MINSRFSRAVDAARVGASFMVVLLHAAAINFDTFNEHWWASNFYDAFTRSCVPVFLMISGALLLSKQEPLSVFLRKRVARVVPPLVFWSVFYMAWNVSNGTDYGTPLQWLLHWVSKPVTFHLWYLYAIVGIYLFVPYLRHIWQASSMSEKNLFLILWLLVSAWPIAQSLLMIDIDIIDTWQLGSFFGYFGYLFLGAYLRQLLETALDSGKPSQTGIVISLGLFVVFSLLTMWATYAYSRHLGQANSLFYDYLSPLVAGASVCAFFLLTQLGAWAQRLAPAMKQMAACALGVYCLHVFVLDIVHKVLGWPQTGLASWWTIPITALLAFLVSGVTILLLRRFRFWRAVT